MLRKTQLFERILSFFPLFLRGFFPILYHSSLTPLVFISCYSEYLKIRTLVCVKLFVFIFTVFFFCEPVQIRLGQVKLGFGLIFTVFFFCESVRNARLGPVSVKSFLAEALGHVVARFALRVGNIASSSVKKKKNYNFFSQICVVVIT